MQENYKILGLNSLATDEEIDLAYKKLKEEYSEKRFAEGEEDNRAAKNLTRLEAAYNEIKISRQAEKEREGNKSMFTEIEKLIKEGNINQAQDKLDTFTDRNAEWHYLQSVIFYKKNWTNECKKQLEIAINMEPYNPKYSESYEKLKKQMEYNQNQFHSGNANYNGQHQNAQMGGTDDSCCDFCATMCCMNLMCNMCCR